tara:strand:- start:7821 stop:8177 length:357 start_codon:yes stop_codon:yes gene_type:complete
MIDNISQATLDVIEAIKKQKVIQFKYGSHDEFRTIKPESFYGDFNGFQGADVSGAGGFRRFSFDRVTEWVGIPIIYKVFVELEVSGYPTDDDVRDYLEPIADGVDPLVYTIKPQSGDK